MKKLVVVFISVLTAVVLASAPSAHAITDNERNGCKKDDYVVRYKYPLHLGDASHKEIGYLLFKRRVSPSDSDNWRWCAIVKFGKEIKGTKHRAMIRIGSRDQGNTGNLVTWYYKNQGHFKYYAGGVALTPGNGRCPVIEGWILYQGNQYARIANGNLPCN
ncbi:hypothetical protein KDA14_05690 [Candidatus Saccharibacteria bacterium]|nr:hypothetical protein [Candidatus Saccharibacteria bacterium]